ncbi:maturation protein [ssRNA phage Gerhypos.2_36]|uniref:Maturation protein n=2 Tax=Leviviricetes TaxID=2842243 RepID=A0A8S5KYE1_9VIRU|nr:maturation protein [ssRNA phage Gerhypos.2_36]QDH88804.1 MAG: hypothetical protein H2Bulk3638_000001 [Leviviridae sp.]DAD50069.1 TPA_asm: maturation protein [ssRNA phage Gerhypos.2_36]
MKLQKHPGSNQILIGAVVHSMSLWRPYWFGNVDPVCGALDGTICDVGYYDLETIYDAVPHHDNSPSVIDVDYHRPNTIRVKDAGPDESRYGNFFGSFRRFTDVLGITRPISRFAKNENFVYHPSSHGTFRAVRSGDRAFNSPPFDDIWFQEQYSSGSMLKQCTVRSGDENFASVQCIDFNQYVIVPGFDGRPSYSVSRRLADINNGGFNQVIIGPDGWYSRFNFTSFSFSFGEGGFDLHFTADWRWDPILTTLLVSPLYGFSYESRFHFTTHLSPSLTPSDFNIGEVRSRRSDLVSSTLMLTYKVLAHFGTASSHGGPDIGVENTLSVDSNHWQPLSPIRGNDIAVFELSKNRIDAYPPSLAFRRRIDSRMRDIRPSSYISTSNAADKIIESINTNLIESVSDLRDLSGLVPEVKKFANLPISVGGFEELMKAGGSEYLRAIYGIRPTLTLLAELPRIKAVLSRLSNLSHEGLNLYGDFSYTFEGEFGRKITKMTTRSKVVLSKHPGPDVSVLLGLNSINALPTASNLWDLIPLSFVIDWFVNSSGNIETLENLMILEFVELSHFVHSYSFKSPFEDEDYDFYRIEPTGSEASLKYYAREISHILPGPVSFGYPFLLPSKPPPWLASFSLLLTRS